MLGVERGRCLKGYDHIDVMMMTIIMSYIRMRSITNCSKPHISLNTGSSFFR
jgi:hypothetical protein